MSDDDWNAWEPQLPSAGFADDVIARVIEERRRSRLRRIGAGAGIGALALAAALLLFLRAPPEKGQRVAHERSEVMMGRRARAVLEPGANVTWNGDDVVQARGDVFYRVEAGARFTVRTPAGDVEVMGTCFSVKVREMNKRDVKSGVIGAGLSALAFVAVYEGKVAVSHASTRVEVTAGENAQVGADGAKRTNPDAVREFDAQPPLVTANENLVSQVGEYRTRLEAVASQKSELEDKLKVAEQRLAASADGGKSEYSPNSRYEPTADEWKELAKNGELRFRYPCTGQEGWTVSPDGLNRLGLAQEDGAAIKDSFERSSQQMSGVVAPMCATALGVPLDVAQRIGVDQCKAIIVDKARQSDKEGASEQQTQAAEIRAGLRAEPPADKQPPVLKLFLALTGAEKSFEGDLAKTFGPEDAHRIASSDELCASNNRLGGGKKR